MSIVTIAASQTRLKAPPKPLVSRDCGPDGCEIDWLASPRHEADLDIENFTAFAMEQGWGDGLPMVPPTETRVRTFLSLNNRYPDEVIAHLPPMRAECTVEKIVINAVMAGAPPESLPLLIAAVEAVAEPDFELYGVNATTASVAPALFVNGPIRNRLGIPYKHGCFGGVQRFYRHASGQIGLPMRFAVYLPPQATQGPVPALLYREGAEVRKTEFAQLPELAEYPWPPVRGWLRW